MRLKGKWKITLILLLGVIAVIAFALPVSWYLQLRRYREGFAQVKLGDSKQSVMTLFGKPSEINDCYHVTNWPVSEDVKDRCNQEYWYYSWFEEWIIVFDSNDKVIWKTYHWSP